MVIIFGHVFWFIKKFQKKKLGYFFDIFFRSKQILIFSFKLNLDKKILNYTNYLPVMNYQNKKYIFIS